MSSIQTKNKKIFTACPICNVKEVPKDSPANSDFESDCDCWICVDCWRNVYENEEEEHGFECPLCGDDITDWLIAHYENVDTDVDTDDSEDD